MVSMVCVYIACYVCDHHPPHSCPCMHSMGDAVYFKGSLTFEMK